MLVLSRKKGEEVLVPEYGIVFTIAEIRGDKVRIGVSAPADIQIYRREVWERMEHGQAAEEAALHPALDSKPRKKG
jgi:carbon storage regulator